MSSKHRAYHVHVDRVRDIFGDFSARPRQRRLVHVGRDDVLLHVRARLGVGVRTEQLRVHARIKRW